MQPVSIIFHEVVDLILMRNKKYLNRNEWNIMQDALNYFLKEEYQWKA